MEQAKERNQAESRFGNLVDLFMYSVGRAELKEKICLEILRPERQETLTFGQLRTGAERFALWLRRGAKIRVGEKVALVGKNRADWDVALWGTILAGGVPVLIDPERPVEGVAAHLIHTDTCVLVMADDYQNAQSREELRQLADNRGFAVVEMTSSFCDLPGDDGNTARVVSKTWRQIEPDDTAVILCTSGTTGDPREVELTHRNLLANIEGSVEKVNITERDRLGHILPPHHSFGLTVGKLLPLRVGAYNVYTNQYRHVGEIIRDKQVTIFIAVPALYSMLAKSIEDALAKEKAQKWHVRLLDRYLPKLVGRAIVRKLVWKKLRFCLSGSAAMPRWVLDTLWRRGLLLYEGYGTTENSPVYGFNDEHAKLGSVGKPIRTIYVKIINDELRALPPYERGEIALGGPCIMRGYYRNPKATESAVWTDEEGTRWLRTGDLGYLDDQGNLFITGRKKYLIVLPGGKNVHPELVEAALSESRFVGEVLVVPGYHKDSVGIVEEQVRAIVKPAWDAIQSHTNMAPDDLARQPELLRKLVWESIHECQQKSRKLTCFEKISSRHLEIRIEEFEKTSTGKIKRELYMRM
jgi:long-chain acyl-CoA synthetase